MEPTSWKIVLERMIDNIITEVDNSNLCVSKQRPPKKLHYGELEATTEYIILQMTCGKD
jgi:hypothetical protein